MLTLVHSVPGAAQRPVLRTYNEAVRRTVAALDEASEYLPDLGYEHMVRAGLRRDHPRRKA